MTTLQSVYIRVTAVRCLEMCAFIQKISLKEKGSRYRLLKSACTLENNLAVLQKVRVSL